MESCLLQFNSIGFHKKEEAICGSIMAEIAKKRPGIVDPLFLDPKAASSVEFLIDCLRTLCDKLLVHKPAANDRAASVFHTREKFRKRPPPGCKGRTHNPQCPNTEKCWTLHPELRPIQSPTRVCANYTVDSNNKSGSHPSSLPSLKHEATARAAIVLLSTRQKQSPMLILDSRASHHMVNHN